MGFVHQLLERPVTFDYGYNMLCRGCRGITNITADVYYDQPNDSHVACRHCDCDIHFGRAVMALRNSADPVLDDHQALSVAWYHTSAIAGWPKETHPMPSSELAFLAGTLPPEGIQSARDDYEHKALHLGTYEAAIESMLRHMRDQNDGATQFFLYRVALRSHGLALESGWRDENLEKVAQITQGELGDVDVIRYLNVHESAGSISLAVRPRAVSSVQGISVPAYVHEINGKTDLFSKIAQIRTQIDQIQAARPADLDSIERIQMNRAKRTGASFSRSPTPEQHVLLRQIKTLTASEYLPGVSRPVRADFIDALDAWREAQTSFIDDGEYISRFASMAMMLSHPRDIIRHLRKQEVREL